MIIKSENLNEIRNIIQRSVKSDPDEKIIVKAGDEDFNKKILELKNIYMLLSPEIHFRKDRMKQKDSGLNEHLCKLAKKNNVKIGIDLPSINNLEKKEKAIILSRVIQNIKLAKRTKTSIVLYPEDKYSNLDIQAFFKTFQGSTEQGK